MPFARLHLVVHRGVPLAALARMASRPTSRSGALAAGADVGVRPAGRIRDIAESLVRLFAPVL